MHRRVLLAVAVAVTAAVAAPASANHAVTDHVSTGPAGGNGAFDSGFQFVSADGSRVLFRTAEQLVAADSDASTDVYERVSGAFTRLVSTGSAGGNGAFDATALAIAEDGSRALFGTQEQLVPGDTDSQFDIYERSGTTTTLVTVGTSASLSFFRASATAAQVYFHTSEQLVPGDTDSRTDVYVRTNGETFLRSTGPVGGNGAFDATARAVSADGIYVVFETDEQLTSDDTDAELDIYRSSGSGPILLSKGPSGENLNGVSFAGASQDTSSVAFHVPATCTGTIFFGCPDLYMRSGATTTKVSPHNADFQGFSKNGAHIYYKTIWEGDGDFCRSDFENDYGCPDIMDLSGGTKRLVSAGGVNNCGGAPEACENMFFTGASADGSRVFFITEEPMTSEDDQIDNCFDFSFSGLSSCLDVYENTAAGGTKLVSKHSAPGATDGLGSGFLGASDDGSRVFYATDRQSAAGDTDNRFDIFERFGNTTSLISIGPGTGNGPFTPTYKGSSIDGVHVFFETGEPLLASDTDSQVDVYDRRMIAPYVRPKGATPLRVPLVPAFRMCTSPNRTHGPPLAFPACSPPITVASGTFIGVGDGDPAPAKSVGSVKAKVLSGTAGPPDDADVQLDVRITNVMNTADRSDYTGELRLELPLRITDLLNGAPVDSGTLIDTSIFGAVPCTPTADPTLGSACSLSTTADALVPGVALEGWKAVWGIRQVRVYDGGLDGDADTPGDNELFAVEGYFVP